MPEKASGTQIIAAAAKGLETSMCPSKSTVAGEPYHADPLLVGL